jgi:hypothetical protein
MLLIPESTEDDFLENFLESILIFGDFFGSRAEFG